MLLSQRHLISSLRTTGDVAGERCRKVSRARTWSVDQTPGVGGGGGDVSAASPIDPSRSGDARRGEALSGTVTDGGTSDYPDDDCTAVCTRRSNVRVPPIDLLTYWATGAQYTRSVVIC